MPPIPSALAARFRIGPQLWSGSSGAAYDATETSTGKVGVLKIVTQASSWTPAERGRLARELEKQTTLNHPYLATPSAAGIAEDVPWIFRDKVEGEALSDLLAAGSLPVPQAITITAQLAAALDELHRAGLLQRDLSPSHVIVRTDGVLPFARLIDSGVATRIPGSAIFEISGKPPYVSPEHAAGKLVSFRSDLYALGSILFEMLSGRALYSGTIEQILEQQRSAPPPSVASVAPNANVPGAITTLLGQLLAKEPRERPFSAQQVRRALEPLVPAGGLTNSQPPAAGGGAGMKRTLIGVQSPTAPKRADGTEELSALDLQQAAAALRPPPPRRDPTMPLEALDLMPAVPMRSVPPPVPGSNDGATIVAAAPRASAAPPPPPERRSSFPPAEGRPSLGGLAVPPPPPGSSGGLGFAPSSSPSSSGGLAIPPAPPPPAPPPPARPAPSAPPPPLVVAAAPPANDLDYDDLAETNAVSREEFEERQVTHRAQAINDLAPVALPAGTFPAGAPMQPISMQQQAYPSTQMQPQYAPPPGAYGAPPPGAYGAPQPYAAPQAYPQPRPSGVPSPFGPTAAMPQGMGTAGPPMPGTQMMPMGAMPQQRPPAGVSQPVSDDEVPGLRRSYTPFLMLGAAVVGCLVLSLAGFGGYVLLFGRPATEAVAVTPTVAPIAAPRPMQPMVPATPPPTSAPVIAAIAPVAIAPLPATTPTTTSTIAPLPPASVAPPSAVAPTPLVAIAPPEPPPPEPAPELTRSGSRTRRSSSRVASAPPPPPPSSAPRSGMLASRIGPAAPTHAATPAPAPSGSGRLASRLGSTPPSSGTAPAPSASGGSFDDLRARARTAFSAHHYDEAAQAYEQASRLQPTNAGIYAGLGAARLAGGHAATAVQAYEHAVQLQPSSAGYHAALGRAYATAGDRTHARAQYEEALRLDPDNRDARTGLDRL